MIDYWKPVSIPHTVLWNDDFVDDALEDLLADLLRTARPRRTLQLYPSQSVINTLEHRHE
jgi:hypothetical protein